MIDSKAIRILILLISFSISISQANKNRVAVLDLESFGVSKMESITLTDQLRSELVKTGTFIIVERSEMNSILEEQGFQVTGCSSIECAVEAGKLLNVNQIFVGSISKVGNLYTLSVQIIDIETSAVIKSVNEDCQCPIERVLTHSIRNITMKLSGFMTIGTTPSISVLSEGNGDIYIISHPPGAKVFINGELLGKTPIQGLRLNEGQYLLQIQKRGYAEFSKKIKVSSTEKMSIEGTLMKLASMNIRSEPDRAEVFLNGEKKGLTPLSIYELYPGKKFTIIVKKYQFKTWEKSLNLIEGQYERIDIELQKQKGRLQFTSFPMGTEIEYKGKRAVLTSKEMEGPIGEYNFSLSAPGYINKEYNLVINEEDLNSINVELDQKTTGSALIRSLFVPGWGQAYQGKTTRSWIYGIAFFGLAAGAFYLTNYYNQSVSDYNLLKEEYNRAVDPSDIDRLYREMETTYADADKSKSLQKTFMLAAGTVWLWNIVDVLVLPPAWEKNVSMSATMDGQSIHAGLSINF